MTDDDDRQLVEGLIAEFETLRTDPDAPDRLTVSAELFAAYTASRRRTRSVARSSSPRPERSATRTSSASSSAPRSASCASAARTPPSARSAGAGTL